MMVVYCHSQASALEHLPRATLSTSGCWDFLEAHSSTITTPFMSNIVLQSESLCYESVMGLLKEQFKQNISGAFQAKQHCSILLNNWSI